MQIRSGKEGFFSNFPKGVFLSLSVLLWREWTVTQTKIAVFCAKIATMGRNQFLFSNAFMFWQDKSWIISQFYHRKDSGSCNSLEILILAWAQKKIFKLKHKRSAPKLLSIFFAWTLVVCIGSELLKLV